MPIRMKDKSKETAVPVTRRRSARLAELDKEKPKEQPKVARKSSEKKVVKSVSKTPKGDVVPEPEPELVVENNHTEEKVEEAIEVAEKVETEDKVEEKAIVEEEKKDEEFVVVEKEDVPDSESAEVKEAIPKVEEKKENPPAVVNGESSETKAKEGDVNDVKETKVIKDDTEKVIKPVEDPSKQEVNIQSA